LNAKEKIVIAIDGPAGSGKSTTAKLVAKTLGYQYIDTGAMYRTLAFKVIKSGIKIDDVDKISRLAKSVKINFERLNDEQHIFLNGEDVTEEIRTPEVTNASSPISAIPAVREVMVDLQRKIGKNVGIVMEGRDIGTVVFPDADVKIFLIASLNERAKRRQADLQKKNINVDIYNLEREILTRDVRDSSRNNSPLIKARDAREIDTTDITIDDQVKRILDIVQAKCGISPKGSD
jgi:cytidylate kinase